VEKIIVESATGISPESPSAATSRNPQSAPSPEYWESSIRINPDPQDEVDYSTIRYNGASSEEADYSTIRNSEPSSTVLAPSVTPPEKADKQVRQSTVPTKPETISKAASAQREINDFSRRDHPVPKNPALDIATIPAQKTTAVSQPAHVLEMYVGDGKTPVRASRWSAFSFSKKKFFAVILGFSSDGRYVWTRLADGREKPVDARWFNGANNFKAEHMVRVDPSLKTVTFYSNTTTSKSCASLDLKGARNLLHRLGPKPQERIQALMSRSFLSRAEAERLHQEITSRAEQPANEKERRVWHLTSIPNAHLGGMKKPGLIIDGVVVGRTNGTDVHLLDARKCMKVGQVAQVLGRSENSDFIIVLCKGGVAAFPSAECHSQQKLSGRIVLNENGFERASPNASRQFAQLAQKRQAARDRSRNDPARGLA
jgi:hypothetical protein